MALRAFLFTHDPSNCTELELIGPQKILENIGKKTTLVYYATIQLTYTNSRKIRFRERTDRNYGKGGYGLVVHYESKDVQDVQDTIYFSLKYTRDKIEADTITKINRIDSETKHPCGQLEIKKMIPNENSNTGETSGLYVFLSKTYNGDLKEFIGSNDRLNKKVVQNIILQIRNQLICLREKYDICYTDIKPANILYFYPGGNDDKKNIEVVLGDLGSVGMTTYPNPWPNDPEECQNGESLSRYQKYSLSLTYLMLRDGRSVWGNIVKNVKNNDPNANRNTVRDVQNALRSDTVPEYETMYRMIWEHEKETSI